MSGIFPDRCRVCRRPEADPDHFTTTGDPFHRFEQALPCDPPTGCAYGCGPGECIFIL